jgi:hypothetical protein
MMLQPEFARALAVGGEVGFGEHVAVFNAKAVKSIDLNVIIIIREGIRSTVSGDHNQRSGLVLMNAIRSSFEEEINL